MVGGVIDGFPAGITVDVEFVQRALDRRRPGQSSISTPRNETDRIEFLSGIFEGQSTGHPMAFVIANRDSRPGDYEAIKNVYRPSHADFTYQQKYGLRDYRGGGRSSARVTAAWVAAGAIAELLLKAGTEIQVSAYVSAVHQIKMESASAFFSREEVDRNPVRCPNGETALKMTKAIEEARNNGDSLGGIITCVIQHCPVGLGEPVFEKLNARLAAAMFSIPAVKGFEIGEGFDIVEYKGSEANDPFVNTGQEIRTNSNHSGGIQGGISNGEDIFFRVAFKPVSTLGLSQKTVNQEGVEIDFTSGGRHDPCVLPRAVPIVEALSTFTLADLYLMNLTGKNNF